MMFVAVRFSFRVSSEASRRRAVVSFFFFSSFLVFLFTRAYKQLLLFYVANVYASWLRIGSIAACMVNEAVCRGVYMRERRRRELESASDSEVTFVTLMQVGAFVFDGSDEKTVERNDYRVFTTD